MPKPVEDYYDEKKRRYLEDMRRAGETMTTGTPFDWEEVGAYTADLPGRPAADGESAEVAELEHRASESTGWRAWLARLFGGRRRVLPDSASG